jgi:hypothetical protein
MTASKRGHGASIRHPLGEKELPPQLPEERLHELVTRVRDGTATTADVEELALGHIRLAIYIASQYTSKATHLQDVFVNEAMFGLAVALSRAPEKLYDDNITPFIVRYIRKYVFTAMVEDRTVSVPYTSKRRRKRLVNQAIEELEEAKKTGDLSQEQLTQLENKIEALKLPITLPKRTSGCGKLHARPSNLYDLKDAIQASITCQFEQEVIELRSLGFTDDEISVMLSCSRSGVSAAKRAVRARFDEVMRDE